MRRNRKSRGDFTQNHGKPGFVYALGNKTLPKYLKIGQTRDLEKRLAALNADCNTSNPIRGFFVAYHRETDDCGRAELHAHQTLAYCRVDAYREFFECDIETARRAIDEACEAFRHKLPKPLPVKAEKPQPANVQEQAASPRYQTQLAAQHALLVARAEEDERARQEEWRKDRAERLRTAERISEINRKAQAKKEAAPPAAEPRPELNPGTFTIGTPAPAAPDPELAQPPTSFSKILLSVLGTIVGIGVLSSLFPAQPSQPVQAAPSVPTPTDMIAGDLATYASHYSYPQAAADDETTLSRVYTEGRNLVFFYKSTDIGEHIIGAHLDEDLIRKNMRATACRKPELLNFTARGASIFYILERKNTARIIEHIACPPPGG